jgi:MFS family permease
MKKVLRDARFRRLLLGETVSGFGDSALYLSLAIWAKDLTGSDAAAGLVFLFITVPSLAAPLLGHLTDRVRSRKALLMRAYAAMAILVLALLAVRSPAQLWLIYLVALAYGVMFCLPARNALLKDLLPSADAAAARSLLIATGEGVRIVSPAVGAAIYLAFGGGALAALDAATFVVAALLLASVRVTESQPEPAHLVDVRGGFRHLRAVPLLARLNVGLVGFMAVAGLVETAGFAAIDEGLGRSAAFFGVVTSVQGGGSVLGGLAAGPLVRRYGSARTASIAYAVMSAGMLLCVARSVPLFLLGAALNGVGLPLLTVAVGTAEHLYTPARLQGRLAAAVTTLSGAAQSLSIAAGAALIGVVDYRVMYALIALTAASCAAALALRPPPAPAVVPSIADSLAGSRRGDT